jgi:hypothetical protein
MYPHYRNFLERDTTPDSTGVTSLWKMKPSPPHMTGCLIYPIEEILEKLQALNLERGK